MKTLKVGCLWAAQAQRDRRFTYDDVQHQCRGVGRVVGGWAVYHTSILAEATRGPVEREREVDSNQGSVRQFEVNEGAIK